MSGGLLAGWGRGWSFRLGRGYWWSTFVLVRMGLVGESGLLFGFAQVGSGTEWLEVVSLWSTDVSRVIRWWLSSNGGLREDKALSQSGAWDWSSAGASPVGASCWLYVSSF